MIAKAAEMRGWPGVCRAVDPKGFLWGAEQDAALVHEVLGKAVFKIMQVMAFPGAGECNRNLLSWSGKLYLLSA